MISKPVRALSFDVHGTLIHSPRLGEVYAEILGRHGVAVETAEAYQVVRRVWQEFSCTRRLGEDRFASHPDGARGWWYRFIDRVCEHLGSDAASPFAKSELYQRFTSPDPWDVYEDVPEVLESLQAAGVRMMVISNWDERLPVLLAGLGLAGFFEAVVYSAQVGAEKPFPTIFHYALDRLDLPPEEVLHVGDRQREDVEGAQAVGMQALYLTRGSDEGDLQDLRPLMELCGAGHA